MNDEESPSVYEILKKYGNVEVEDETSLFYIDEERMQIGGRYKVNKAKK